MIYLLDTTIYWINQWLLVALIHWTVIYLLDSTTFEQLGSDGSRKNVVQLSIWIWCHLQYDIIHRVVKSEFEHGVSTSSCMAGFKFNFIIRTKNRFNSIGWRSQWRLVMPAKRCIISGKLASYRKITYPYTKIVTFILLLTLFLKKKALLMIMMMMIIII